VLIIFKFSFDEILRLQKDYQMQDNQHMIELLL